MLELKGNGYLDQLQRIWIDDASVCNNVPDVSLVTFLSLCALLTYAF